MQRKLPKIKNCNPSKIEDLYESKNLKDLLDDFKRRYRDCVVSDEEFYKNLDLETAIEKAALAEDEVGRRFSHQRRIAKVALVKAQEELNSNVAQIEQARDFDNLLKTIQAILQDVSGLGELFYYDTSARIGLNLGLIPSKVYLHRGTRIGALAIDKRFKRLESIDPADLPSELRNETAVDLEDFLCIYKDRLKKLYGRT